MIILVAMVDTGASYIPFFIISTIAATSHNFYFLIIMASMVTFVKTLYANDRVILQLAFKAFESIHF
jgi:hypothetical protein